MLTIKLRPHYNPGTGANDEYCACHMTKGLYTFDEMADDIAHSCSLTRADVVGCMEAMIEQTKEKLLAGYVVEYRRLGKFCINTDSRLATDEEVHAPFFQIRSIINGYRLRFWPHISIRNWLKTNAVPET